MAKTLFYAELLALAPAERLPRLTAWLQAGVAATLRLPEGRRPEPQRGFFELGMDSLMAIEVKNRLQGELGVPLRATVVFNYPNIGALADYLAGLFPAAPAEPILPALDAGEMARLLEREARAVLGGEAGAPGGRT
jgi:acyl carrier protein